MDKRKNIPPLPQFVLQATQFQVNRHIQLPPKKDNIFSFIIYLYYIIID